MRKRKNEFAFTPTRIASIISQESNQIFYDANQMGLRLLVSPAGTKSFQFQAWSSLLGKPLTRTLGKVGRITIEEARKQAAALLVEVNSGSNIEQEKRKKLKARQSSMSVKEFSAVFLERHCKAKELRSISEISRILEKNILPEIGQLKMNEVEKADLIELLDKIEDRNALTACNRTLSVLSKLFNFAHERDVIKFPPTFGVKKRGTEVPRDRVLNDQEIMMLLKNLGDSVTASMIKFLLATGQRSNEARLMKLTDIEGDIWKIPASNTKNKSVHKIPLTPYCKAIIAGVERNQMDNEFVFPGKNGALDSCAANRYLQRLIKPFDWPRTTIHDLRRTVKTYFGKLGVPKNIKDEVLNHEKKGMDKYYDHYDYLPEIATALKKWNEYLGNLCA